MNIYLKHAKYSVLNDDISTKAIENDIAQLSYKLKENIRDKNEIKNINDTIEYLNEQLTLLTGYDQCIEAVDPGVLFMANNQIDLNSLVEEFPAVNLDELEKADMANQVIMNGGLTLMSNSTI